MYSSKQVANILWNFKVLVERSEIGVWRFSRLTIKTEENNSQTYSIYQSDVFLESLLSWSNQIISWKPQDSASHNLSNPSLVAGSIKFFNIIRISHWDIKYYVSKEQIDTPMHPRESVRICLIFPIPVKHTTVHQIYSFSPLIICIRVYSFQYVLQPIVQSIVSYNLGIVCRILYI